MSTLSTRQRLTQAALELFLSQGVSHTTTRQIADRAGVNEATLFRNFGNKYGLLLAMLQETPTVSAEPKLVPVGKLEELRNPAGLRSYASECLDLLEQVSNFVRSVIGEADQYSPEHRQALQQRLIAIKQDMAQNLSLLLGEDTARLSADDWASFLGALLLGYTMIETTSGSALWEDREDFLDALVTLLVEKTGLINTRPSASENALASSSPAPPMNSETLIADLPAVWVHQMMKQAKALDLQDYALAYILFGAGPLPEEIVLLEKAHHICDKSQNILQVIGPESPRQVPINQWILGKRYGSYTNNPLTKWLKSRKDNVAAMFINEAAEPLTVSELQQRWHLWWQDIDVGAIHPQLDQARQTWCVEMLMRGIDLENLSILTGCDLSELNLYAQRAREKAAIAAATQLDRKVSVTS